MAGRLRTLLRWALGLIALVAMSAALVVLAIAIGAALDPTHSYFATMSSSLWTTFGPHFVATGFIATALSAGTWRWGFPRFGRIATATCSLALLGAIYIVWSIMAAAMAAGGFANPLAGLWLGQIHEPPPDRTEAFQTVDGQALQAAIYLPSSSVNVAPVLTYIHGGGFITGTRTETAADLRWFADRGWIVFSIDYRLFTPGKPTWDKAPADVACGLAWTSSNARRFGGNAERMILLGDSAGGNLAINLGYGAAQGLVSSTCGTVPVPKAIVVQYPAVDPIAIYQRGFPMPGFEPQMLMKGYIGGTPEQYPDRIKSISSASFISDKAPPTLIIEPDKDGLVVSDSVHAFAAKAKAAGIDIELVRIPFANHVYNQIAANSIGNQARLTITENYLRTKDLAP